MGDRLPSAGRLGVLAILGLGACCGVSLLLSAGLVGSIAGIGFGSPVILALGTGITLLAVIRRTRRRGTDSRDAHDASRTAGV